MSLLHHYLKTLKLPTFLSEYERVASACVEEKASYETYLTRLSEKEYVHRQEASVQQRIKKAKFPVFKTLETFDFETLPSLNKPLILELSKSAYLDKKENVLALGNAGTGKTHIAIALGLSACHYGKSVYFTQASQLVHTLLEAREERVLLKLKKKLLNYDLLIIDEMGFVPFSKSGAELLFDIFSGRYELGSVMLTSNLPFSDWTQIFGCERLTGALLDRLTHHAHILEMNGQSYRLAHAKSNKQKKEVR